MVLEKKFSRLDMYGFLAITIIVLDIALSSEARNTQNNQEKREKRQNAFSPVIPSEIKEEFKNYAKSYLNNMVEQMSNRNKQPAKQEPSTSRARICAEVCQHRCLPSCEWSCCIKENIEEYRSAHLVKPLVQHPSVQRKSDFAGVDKGSVRNDRPIVGRRRENIEEPLKDGNECNPSCKRYCVPSCRFACCQPVQIKGVLLL
ncbi:uncharacterized protein LOC114531815 isoform X2 [Dendronephthya gigantea]|nr:uncharacterized protein LOC114531815 isoform X2 [Dendronephthya gigantea]